ncbi:MAG: hypothetical protein GXY14_16340 [Spirochaetes bacterium]|nr:hypothetical protein [Spirochaetota bacterium]
MRSRLQILLVTVVAALASGFLAGIPAGLLIEKSAVNGSFYLPALSFRPSENFAELIRRLNSNDPLLRLTGYYIYRETGLVDLEFLLKRYEYDDTGIIRKTIIWIAFSERDIKKLSDFYGKIFEISTPELQHVIILNVKKLGSQVYSDFMLKHKIIAR